MAFTASSKIKALATAAVALSGLAGCAGHVEGSQALDRGAGTPGDTTATDTAAMVTLQGRVVGTDGGSLAGVDVIRLALDPYLEPVLHAQSTGTGAFVVGPVAGNSREWLTFQMPGHVNVYQAFETGDDAVQAMPAATLLTDGEAADLAQKYGVTLDATRSVLRIPVVVGGAGATRPAPAGGFDVSFVPPVDTPVAYVDGEAIAFNVPSSGIYDVTVHSGGRACAPASHPELVQPDGSVKVGSIEGFFTVGPAILCP